MITMDGTGALAGRSSGIQSREDYEALLQFLYLAPVGLAQLTPAGDFVMLNPVSSQLLMPLARGGHLTNLFTALEGVAPDLRNRFESFDQPHGMVCDGVQFAVHPGTAAKRTPQTLSISLLKLDETRSMAVLSDVTEQVRRERLLRQNEASPSPDAESAYETLMQFLYRAPIGLIQTGIDGAIEMINPMAANLLMPLSVTGALDNLFDALAAVAPQLRRLVADFDAPTGEICESLRLGEAGSAAAGALPVLSFSLLKLDETRLMATLTDATADVNRERRGLATKLDAALRVDSLTRLPNRAVVRELIEQAMARPASSEGSDFAVLFLNCDRFRQINDALGHAAGDEVLGLLADRVRSTLRQRHRAGGGGGSEYMAGRVGGDEFVVVLDDLRFADDVHIVAHRLLEVLGKPYGIRADHLHCSVSIGIVLRAHIGPGADADSVLQDASIAMVEAKRAGGARHAIFEPAMQARAARRSAVENDLRRALAGDQLFVVYQPVVGLRAGDGTLSVDQAAGVEALVRWRHPTRGIVPPLEFVGVAEECGMIGALGEFVLETACRQFVAWQHTLGAAAPKLLAVNLSRGQLSDTGFAATVAAILLATGMAPAQLQLEITESLAAQDENVQTRLHELKALGLTLALDDFGTGYSSLASLHLLPVDTVKIDRSFVSRAVESLHHRVLIEATVRVACSLKMHTVAEGIETEDQARLVRQLGCEKGQGYFFGRPMEAKDIPPWLMLSSAAPVMPSTSTA